MKEPQNAAVTWHAIYFRGDIDLVKFATVLEHAGLRLCTNDCGHTAVEPMNVESKGRKCHLQTVR